MQRTNCEHEMTDPQEPTVPESAPRETRSMRCDMRTYDHGVPGQCTRKGYDTMDGPAAVVRCWQHDSKRNPSAPRPVPETAALCVYVMRDGRPCMYPERSVVHIGQFGPYGHVFEPPAPPAEPVEEAQPFSMFIEAFEAGAFDPPVEVEDEGARPLTVDELRALILGPDNSAQGWALAAFEAAICKEATAALDAWLERYPTADALVSEVKLMKQEQLMFHTIIDRERTRAEAAERVNEARAEAYYQLTVEYGEAIDRAEAAEGALQERDEALWRAAIRIGILVGRMRGRDDHDGRTGEPDAHTLSIQEGEQWLADMAAEFNERAARAFTAESVTPKEAR